MSGVEGWPLDVWEFIVTEQDGKLDKVLVKGPSTVIARGPGDARMAALASMGIPVKQTWQVTVRPFRGIERDQ